MRTFLILSLLLLTACGDMGSYGHDFAIGKTGMLVAGASTPADAKKLFGEPTNIEKAKESDHVLYEWTYGYYSFGASRVKHLAISFDGQGRMIKVVDRSGG